MNEDPNDKCVCGHMRMVHPDNDAWKGYCIFCFGEEFDIENGQHYFRLDNLSYIERLAKERKLI